MIIFSSYSMMETAKPSHRSQSREIEHGEEMHNLSKQAEQQHPQIIQEFTRSMSMARTFIALRSVFDVGISPFRPRSTMLVAFTLQKGKTLNDLAVWQLLTPGTRPPTGSEIVSFKRVRDNCSIEFSAGRRTLRLFAARRGTRPRVLKDEK